MDDDENDGEDLHSQYALRMPRALFSNLKHLSADRAESGREPRSLKAMIVEAIRQWYERQDDRRSYTRRRPK